MIDDMHYEFKLRAQRIDSSDRIDFEPWEIDTYLNMAIKKFCKERFGLTFKTKRGFETDTVRIAQLSNLHVKSPELQSGVTATELEEGLYEVSLNKLGKDIDGQYFRCMFLTKGKVEIIKDDGCSKTITISHFQTDDSKTIYTDANYDWGRVTYTFGKSTYQHPHYKPAGSNQHPDETMVLDNDNRYNEDELVSLYLDTRDRKGVKQFSIGNVYLSYVKYPNRVFIGGYDTLDGMSTTDSPKIHCDLDSIYHDEIIRIAVRMAEEDIISDYSAKLQSEIRDLEY